MDAHAGVLISPFSTYRPYPFQWPRFFLLQLPFRIHRAHHEILEEAGFEIVRERGPLSEEKMLDLAGEFDAFLCGDDAITRAVIDKSLPRLKIISKYGIGLDKIDVTYATEKKIPITFCPG